MSIQFIDANRASCLQRLTSSGAGKKAATASVATGALLDASGGGPSPGSPNFVIMCQSPGSDLVPALGKV
jgi:hypothetical protein